MKPQIGVFVAAVVAFVGATPAGAQKPDKACALLTTQEVAAAVGGKVADGRENSYDVDEGPSKGKTMHSCTWMVGPMQGVTLNVIEASTGAERTAGEASIRKTLDDLKEKGWTEKIEDSGDPKCAELTPPTKGMAAPSVTSCLTESKGSAIGIGYMYVGQTVPSAKVKALLAEAVARLK